METDAVLLNMAELPKFPDEGRPHPKQCCFAVFHDFKSVGPSAGEIGQPSTSLLFMKSVWYLIRVLTVGATFAHLAKGDCEPRPSAAD